ncbi:MAG: hypothetical protein CM15mP103_12450 [Gammaproteobacteria bacterium]|nr:MAG: hypothetical protein CM15mP103_12450 [Gammaproteobacteria bacterium]
MWWTTSGAGARLLDFWGPSPFWSRRVGNHKTDRTVRTPSAEQVRQPIYRWGPVGNFEKHLDPLGPRRRALETYDIHHRNDFFESRRFIFFAVPKTGTHSIREVLRVHWPRVIGSNSSFRKTAIPVPKIAGVNHGHVVFGNSGAIGLPAEGVFSIRFFRHPFYRFVSSVLFPARK